MMYNNNYITDILSLIVISRIRSHSVINEFKFGKSAFNRM